MAGVSSVSGLGLVLLGGIMSESVELLVLLFELLVLGMLLL